MKICNSYDCTSQNDRFKLFSISVGLCVIGFFGISFLPEKPRQLNLLNAEAPQYAFNPLTYHDYHSKMEEDKVEWKHSLEDVCYYWPTSDLDKCDPVARKPRLAEESLKF